MTDAFGTLGFLSSEIAEFRESLRTRFGAQLGDVERVFKIAIADLRLANGHAPPSYVVGVGFWLRCIESCQGAVLLAERGLPTAPYATLRTAFECLFSACALWRKPQVAAKMDAWHHEERVRQARQLISVGAEDRVSPEGLVELRRVAAEQSPSSGWSHWEAACAAELQFEYAMMYRGLGISGAHASPRSLDDFYSTRPDGSLDMELQPSGERLPWLLDLVVNCLSIGSARHSQARAALAP